MKRLWAMLAMLVFWIGCSGAEKKKPIMTTEQFEENAPTDEERHEAECTDEDGDAFECEDDSECCDGYSCAKDPARSHRIKYCTPG